MKTIQEALNNVIKELEDKNPEAKKKIVKPKKLNLNNGIRDKLK